MIKLEIHFDTREELLAFLNPEQALTTETPQEPRTRKAKGKPVQGEIASPELDLKTVELSGEKLPDPEPEPVVTLTYEEVSAALLGLAKRKGRDAAIEVLSEYGVAKLTDLPRDKWAAIKSHAEARTVAP